MENKGKYIEGLVSVVIPTYGRSDTLERAINSVKQQTYTNIEILVVDDNEIGSEYSQAVAEMIKQLGYDNLHLVTQPQHINGAAARNAGIRAAGGEYIAFLDDDDFFLPNKIEEQLAVLKELDSSYGAVSCQKVYIKNNKLDHVSEVWQDTEHQNFDIVIRKINVTTSTLLMRRTCLDETGYFDESLRRNQEIQLLTFFSDKYRIKLVDKFLAVIDCTDVMNRPDSEKTLMIKGLFFEAIKPITSKYSKHKQKLIVAHNMTDVLRAYLREKKIKKAFALAARIFVHPSVLVAFCKFVYGRVVGRKMDKQLTPEITQAVYELAGGLLE
ncbi:MAG: glycosyltransferase family 2 protein [Oscillospiraceae bacterium]|nr:glycosyltransferase family 2 protein [Oscillospiraceae bacterium]